MENKKKKTRWTRTRHAVVFAFFRPIGRLFCKLFCGYSAKMNKLEKGKSYLIIANHTVFADQFLVGSYFNRPLYFIASDDLFNKWTGKYLSWLVAPIPKAKSSKDLSAIRNAKKVINEGGSVMVFPEGNRTFGGDLCYVDIAIAKFAKVMKTDLIIYNITGGFGVDPRFGRHSRRGKSHGEIREIIPADVIAEMGVEELYARIIEGLTVPKTLGLFKGKNRAEYAERALYTCPNCGKIDEIYSDGNYIKCKNCDLQVEYMEDLSLKVLAGNCDHKTLAEWYAWQNGEARRMFGVKTDVVLSDDNLQLFEIKNKKLKVIGDFDVRFSQDNGFDILNKGGVEFLNLPFDDVLDIAMQGKSKITIYTKNSVYNLKAKYAPTNLMKYMHMFYLYKQIKGGIEGNADLFLGL